MKRILSIILTCSLLLASLLLSGCSWLVTTSEGKLTTKAFDFTDFNEVEVGDAFTVDISSSEAFSIEITSNDSAFRSISAAKKGNVLKIGLKGLHPFVGSRILKARITMPELAGLDISGATRATVKGFASSGDFNTRISGSSDLDIAANTGDFVCEASGGSRVTARIKSTAAHITQSGAGTMDLDMETGDFVYDGSGASSARGVLNATSTTIRLTGASDMQLTGKGGNLKITGSGASEASLEGFNIDNADVDLSGATRADIDINGELSVSLSGGSELKYGGNPRLGDRMDITGGSQIERR